MGRKGFERRAPERRREAILAAAAAILREKDYHDIRMDDVASRAGVAKGTLYLYFPTKDLLFGAFAKAMFEGMRAHWKALADTTAPGEERLRATIRAQLEFFEKNRGIFVQVLQGMLPSPAGSGTPSRAEIIREILRLMEGDLREAMKGGFLRKSDPARAAMSLFGLIRGFAIASILGGIPCRLTDQTDFIWDSFYRGFRP
jgi:AcrR family transcriptional regulator